MPLPKKLYQCKSCTKIIAKVNPKAPANLQHRMNLIREDNNGPFSQPQGWCQFCKTEYEVKKEDLILSADLKHGEKVKLGKEIAKQVETKKEPKIEENKETSMKDKFMSKKGKK